MREIKEEKELNTEEGKRRGKKGFMKEGNLRRQRRGNERWKGRKGKERDNE